MYKLVIMIEEPADPELFDRGWPEFLRFAEAMPGLRRESTSRIAHMLLGSQQIALIHELYFDNRHDAHAALDSPAGRNAGQALQTLTAGRMTLLLADHLEDEVKNFSAKPSDAGAPNEDVDE